MEPPTIPSNLVRVVENATKPLFGLLTSAMHMSWLQQIGGRLKSDYRYSIGLVYNTFPVPPVPENELRKIEPLAQAILDARAAHPDASLADLYDPNLMPTNLRKAHHALDQAVDHLYRPSRFSSERERAEHLLALYEGEVAPLAKAWEKKPRSRRTKKATST